MILLNPKFMYNNEEKQRKSSRGRANVTLLPLFLFYSLIPGAFEVKRPRSHKLLLEMDLQILQQRCVFKQLGGNGGYFVVFQGPVNYFDGRRKKERSEKLTTNSIDQAGRFFLFFFFGENHFLELSLSKKKSLALFGILKKVAVVGRVTARGYGWLQDATYMFDKSSVLAILCDNNDSLYLKSCFGKHTVFQTTAKINVVACLIMIPGVIELQNEYRRLNRRLKKPLRGRNVSRSHQFLVCV